MPCRARVGICSTQATATEAVTMAAPRKAKDRFVVFMFFLTSGVANGYGQRNSFSKTQGGTIFPMQKSLSSEPSRQSPAIPPEERKARILAAIAEMRYESRPIRVREVAQRSGVPRATIYRDAALRSLIESDDSVTETLVPDPLEQAQSELKRLRLRNRQLQERYEAVRLRQEQTALQVVREANRCERFQTEVQRQKRQLQTLRDLIDRQQSRVDEAEDRVYQAEQIARKAKLYAEEQERLRAELENRMDTRSAGRSGAVDEARNAGYKSGYEAGARVAMRAAKRGGLGNTLSEAAAGLSPSALTTARRRLARVLHPDLFAEDPDANLLATEILKQLNALAAPLSSR